MKNAFENLYNDFENHYVNRHGRDKLKTLKEKLYNSSKIAQLNGLSIRDRVSPTVGDIGTHIHSIPYFIFAGQETCVMAEFIVVKYWNENVNRIYHFADEYELARKGEYIMKKWGKSV